MNVRQKIKKLTKFVLGYIFMGVPLALLIQALSEITLIQAIEFVSVVTLLSTSFVLGVILVMTALD